MSDQPAKKKTDSVETLVNAWYGFQSVLQPVMFVAALGAMALQSDTIRVERATSGISEQAREWIQESRPYQVAEQLLDSYGSALTTEQESYSVDKLNP